MLVRAEHRLLDSENFVIDERRVFRRDLFEERVQREDPIGNPEKRSFGVDAAILSNKDVYPVRDDFVHDYRIVPVVLRPVRRGELRRTGRHRRGRLEDVVRLEFSRETLTDLLVPVLLDFAQTHGGARTSHA